MADGGGDTSDSRSVVADGKSAKTLSDDAAVGNGNVFIEGRTPPK